MARGRNGKLHAVLDARWAVPAGWVMLWLRDAKLVWQRFGGVLLVVIDRRNYSDGPTATRRYV